LFPCLPQVAPPAEFPSQNRAAGFVLRRAAPSCCAAAGPVLALPRCLLPKVPRVSSSCIRVRFTARRRRLFFFRRHRTADLVSVLHPATAPVVVSCIRVAPSRVSAPPRCACFLPHPPPTRARFRGVEGPRLRAVLPRLLSTSAPLFSTGLGLGCVAKSPI
jgi:hypothetical protein